MAETKKAPTTPKKDTAVADQLKALADFIKGINNEVDAMLKERKDDDVHTKRHYAYDILQRRIPLWVNVVPK